MTIDEIFELWDVDSKIDRNDLGREAIDIPKLHNKYYRIYIQEKLKLIGQESELKQLSALRYDFYTGTIDNDTLKNKGWYDEFIDIGRKTTLKSEIPRLLEADKYVVDKTLKISIQREKVALLDSIIKSLVNRGFNIRDGISWAKFQTGA